MQTIELPDSKVQIKFTDRFSPDAMATFTRHLAGEEEATKAFQKDTRGQLAELGIEIAGDDLQRVTDEDLLILLGRRPGSGFQPEAVSPAIVVRVAISVVTYAAPGSAH